jgi:hypothetical protein
VSDSSIVPSHRVQSFVLVWSVMREFVFRSFSDRSELLRVAGSIARRRIVTMQFVMRICVCVCVCMCVCVDVCKIALVANIIICVAPIVYDYDYVECAACDRCI